MYIISQSGKEKLITLVEENSIHEISRTIAKKYKWAKFNVEYNNFYINVFDKIRLLSKYHVKQRKCLEFYLDLILTLGDDFLEDPNYLWIKKYYTLNSYLPELDLANKLDNLIADYKKQVLGDECIFLKEAIKKLKNVETLGIEEIYPEKYIYLTGIGFDFKIQSNMVFDEKIGFVLGCNFKNNRFLKQYIVNDIFNVYVLSEVMES